MSSSSKRIDNIQLWRVVAVLGIFVGHLFQKISAPDTFVRRITDNGSLCVELFFLISGFLAIKHFDERRSTNSWEYYKTRAIRILPLYYFVILYFFITETFIFHDVPQDPSGIGWLRYIVFFLYGNIRSGNEYFDFWTNLGSVWTICVFMTFYLLMPLFARVIRNYWYAVSVTLIFWIVRVLMIWKQPAYFHTLTYFVFFSFGITIWYAYKEKKETFVYIFLAFFIGMGIIAQGTIFGLDNLVYATIAFSLLVLSTMDFHYSSEKARKVMDVIDKYSYTVYLAQGIIFCGVIDKLQGVPIFLVLIISVLGTALLSYGIYNYIESPVQHFLLRTQKKS